MLKENQHIEFKSGFNDEVIETLSAFANTKGGKILIGVRNDGVPVKGFIVGEESIQQWLNEIKTKTQPVIIPSAEVVEFKEIGGGFMVTVSYSEQKTNTVPENVPEKRQNSIIDLMKNNSEISMLELSEILNVNHKTIKRDIEKLKAKGLIERIGSNKGGYWKIIEKR